MANTDKFGRTLTHEECEEIAKKIAREVEDGTFKGDPEQYLTLLYCSKSKDVTKWNEWIKKSRPRPKIKLEGACLFSGYLNGINLSGAQMEGASFEDTQMVGANLIAAHLEGAKLSSINLEKAIIFEAHLEEAELINAHINGANLRSVHLEGANLRNIHTGGANFCGARMEGAKLINAHLGGAILNDIYIGTYTNTGKETEVTNFEGTYFGDAVLSINSKSNIGKKKQIKMLSKAIVNNIQFIDPVFGRKVRDEAWLHHFKKNCRKPWYKALYKMPLLWVWRITSNYGRNLFLWAFWSLLIALIFGVVFGRLGPEHFKPKPEGYTWFSFFYYSIVTFTTLGFGDITPITWCAEILVVVEVILGYLMLGGLISILANILARRND